MKTTLIFPDDLMMEVKIESVRRHRKLKDFVPELVRAGLAAQRQAMEGTAQDAESGRRVAASTWITAWQELGKRIESKATGTESCVTILEADRGTRG